ncbi:MAG: hypothetical protein II309_04425 [Bacilli bacterium]|nr:hypothetical protein [Bacilli bacterium]
MDKLTLISDLELTEVRCKIENINKKGEKTYIKVFNILGDRRNEILEELETIMSIHEEVNEETFNNFYIGLIIEFTDIIMDKDDITFMLKEGNLTSKILMQEINDMIYELQYESAMNNLANVRTMSLGMLTQEALKSMKYTELRIAKENERVERLVKHKVKKPSRRFVK